MIEGSQENIDTELLTWARENLKGFVDDENYARMISGLSYDPWQPRLLESKLKAQDSLTQLRNLRLEDFPGPVEYHTRRQNDAREVLGQYGDLLFVEPFAAEYGFNISVGANFYANVDATFVDVSCIRIGNDVVLAPGVTLCTWRHPAEFEPGTAKTTSVGAYPITIGDRVWIGANATVIGGVTIGDGAVIAAGAVVRKDVPANVIFGGRDGRVLRKIDN